MEPINENNVIFQTEQNLLSTTKDFAKYENELKRSPMPFTQYIALHEFGTDAPPNRIRITVESINASA